MNDCKNKKIIVLIIVLVLIIVGLCCYILIYNENVMQDEEELYGEYNIDLVLDDSRVINSEDDNITYGFRVIGKFLDVVEGRDEYILYLNKNDIFEFDNTIDVSKLEDEYHVSFDNEVVDIKISRFGLDRSLDTVLFLMEDGTINYIPILYFLSNVNDFSFDSFDEVDGVIRLVDIEAHYNVVGGYTTVIAQKADGTYYDLFNFVKKYYYYN